MSLGSSRSGHWGLYRAVNLGGSRGQGQSVQRFGFFVQTVRGLKKARRIA